MNTLRAATRSATTARSAAFEVHQDAPASHPELRPHRIAIGLYDRAGRGAQPAHRVELDVTGAVTEVPGARRTAAARPGAGQRRRPDLRQDPAGRALTAHRWSASIGAFDASLPATLCWAAAWDMTRDAEMSTQDFLALVRAGAPSIDQISVLERVLLQVSVAVRRYAATRRGAPPRWPSWTRPCAAGCWRPSPARTSSSPTRRRSPESRSPRPAWTCSPGCWPARGQVPGLAIDTELRWQLLHRLVSRGLTGPEAIDAELARDATDAGERYAQMCRAAIPAPEAKAASWAAIVSGTLPNATFRASAARLRRPGPGRPARAVRGAVLCRAAGHVAGRRVGHGAVLRPGRLSSDRDQRAAIDGTTRPTSSSSGRRPRWRGCSRKDATTWPARCAASGGRPRRRSS